MKKYAVTLFVLGREVLTLLVWRVIDNEQEVPEQHEVASDRQRSWRVGFRGVEA